MYNLSLTTWLYDSNKSLKKQNKILFSSISQQTGMLNTRMSTTQTSLSPSPPPPFLQLSVWGLNPSVCAVCAAFPESLHWCVLWALPEWRACRVLQTRCTPSPLLHAHTLKNTHDSHISFDLPALCLPFIHLHSLDMFKCWRHHTSDFLLQETVRGHYLVQVGSD